MTGINSFLGHIKDVVVEAKKETINERQFLKYCGERLPITFPKDFLRIYYYEEATL